MSLGFQRRRKNPLGWNVCWSFQSVLSDMSVAALQMVHYKQTCYKHSHSLSGFCQHFHRTQSSHLSDLLFSIWTSLDKKQLECLSLLHVVGRGRRVLCYGCHRNSWGHWGGRLDHQVGSAGHRVGLLRGHRHMWVMGRRYAHAIGHLGFRFVDCQKKQKPTPICCMDGRRAHCCCMSIPCILCIIGPTWIDFKKELVLQPPAEDQHQLPWGSVAPPRCTHLKEK